MDLHLSSTTSVLTLQPGYLQGGIIHHIVKSANEINISFLKLSRIRQEYQGGRFQGFIRETLSYLAELHIPMQSVSRSWWWRMGRGCLQSQSPTAPFLAVPDRRVQFGIALM